MSSTDPAAHQREIINRYARPRDARGLFQILSTLIPLGLLWYGALRCATVSYYLTAAAVPFISLLTLRVFALMHDCGHGSLFRSRWLNRSFGLALGVIVAMPQYVWAQHHSYHHAHNGNWDKYRGPYSTRSTDEYAAMSPSAQRLYRRKCSIQASPIAGFIYLIANPRLTWIRGSIDFAWHALKGKFLQPQRSLTAHARSFVPRYWKSAKEYRHMTWNNLLLIGGWVLMCSLFSPGLFFSTYLVSLSLAGAVGIVLFTVQHNFEHAYASDGAHWSYAAGAIRGTSFLVLPSWLNWFTADIGYHHIHHLSSHIPNYCLARCHAEQEPHFQKVTRLRLSQVRGSLKCILWDTRARRIISVREYQQQLLQELARSQH